MYRVLRCMRLPDCLTVLRCMRLPGCLTDNWPMARAWYSICQCVVADRACMAVIVLFSLCVMSIWMEADAIMFYNRYNDVSCLLYIPCYVILVWWCFMSRNVWRMRQDMTYVLHFLFVWRMWQDMTCDVMCDVWCNVWRMWQDMTCDVMYDVWDRMSLDVFYYVVFCNVAWPAARD